MEGIKGTPKPPAEVMGIFASVTQMCLPAYRLSIGRIQPGKLTPTLHAHARKRYAAILHGITMAGDTACHGLIFDAVSPMVANGRWKKNSPVVRVFCKGGRLAGRTPYNTYEPINAPGNRKPGAIAVPFIFPTALASSGGCKDSA